MNQEFDRPVRPTLEAVAARAGVSRATVSRVVNNSPTVDATLRDAVLQAVAELGYVPNQAARSLVTARTDTYTLVLTESAGRFFSDDSYFPALVQGVSQQLEESGKELVLQMVTSERSPGRIRERAAGRRADGVMVASVLGADPLTRTLARLGVPIVVNGRPRGPLSVPYVDVANTDGARLAVRHLVRQGRRRIATIAGSQSIAGGIDRLAGYGYEMKDAGLPPLAAIGDFTGESGESAMRHLLDADPGVDAVFAASDLMALGALRTLRRAGRRVPDDVALIGFDDTAAARHAQPPLTTVHQPIVDIGRTMARQIIRQAAGERIEPSVVLPAALMIRESA
ncbi:LacI family DNA-binding transcriptional regulator [Actinoplanes sp. N902-109]|uniref:LacI family DNA-binding transcriptional regulator n=1 Tax=Actinoplanes sp. (strain N902-109) TaxID=649831 RepID=UPI0003295579|nr:LacI family DNA-binding transcriptional regulator [Actinoplanes sp. N902-109]AGL18403.1 periplasmic binding protein/LacI transcriptional regulator [Actinoplanes sp. N902-109]